MADKSKREQQLEQRLIDLETTLGLLQHDFEAQNEMILVNNRQLDQLQRAVRRLTTMVEAIPPSGASEPRNLEDEKPPHY